jgi:hypothetical protein
MSCKNYLNANGEILYVIHFPGTGAESHENIIEDNLNREFSISDKISIISIMNESAYEDSILRTQCDKNNIKIYNTALDEENWSNPLKIKHVLQSIELVDTEYVLVLDGRDVVISHDLDDEFIEKYLAFNKPIVYNGTPAMYPSVSIEPLQDILKIKGKQKFINAGVCIGTKEAIKTFYSKAYEIRSEYSSTKSEQLLIRMTARHLPNLVTHDSENKIFRICHSRDTVVKEVDSENIMLI